jgi:hypothetical protein
MAQVAGYGFPAAVPEDVFARAVELRPSIDRQYRPGLKEKLPTRSDRQPIIRT